MSPRGALSLVLSSLSALAFAATALAVACTDTATGEPRGGRDAPSDSGACPAGQVLVYDSPGCGAAAKPACEPTPRDACAGPAACGCDGKTQLGACGSQTAPYAHLGPCEDATDDASDGGVCPPGQALFYASPGCGAAAKPACEATFRDACAGPVACGCDGETQWGACGSQTAPYAHLGPCEDAADDAGGDAAR